MRINVSAEAGFFHHEDYREFECLLAAVAAGCMHVNAVSEEGEIDVQVNSVINALPAGQYIYDPSYSVTRFNKAPLPRSMVTMEIDHINEQAEGIHEQLVCMAAIALVAGIYGEWQGQNCWSKMHGSSAEQTGWAEGVMSHSAVKATTDTVRLFARNQITAEQMVLELRLALMKESEASLVHKTGAAQHLHAGET